MFFESGKVKKLFSNMKKLTYTKNYIHNFGCEFLRIC